MVKKEMTKRKEEGSGRHQTRDEFLKSGKGKDVDGKSIGTK